MISLIRNLLALVLFLVLWGVTAAIAPPVTDGDVHGVISTLRFWLPTFAFLVVRQFSEGTIDTLLLNIALAPLAGLLTTVLSMVFHTLMQGSVSKVWLSSSAAMAAMAVVLVLLGIYAWQARRQS